LIIFGCEGETVNYVVRISKQADKTIAKAPRAIQQKFALLIDDLEKYGPIRKDWPNFSPLGNDLYHCHVSYSWVAVWRNEKGTVLVEVEYAGSREKAPY
jgi:mRNA-degrading endonuclease RelE of RelBE toxin-antitoxin system